MNRDGLIYRRGVGMMLLNGEGKVLVGQRTDMISDAWQMPQGGIDAGEDPTEAAWRELREEVGTDKADLIAQTKGWLTYEFPNDLIPELWGGQFRGQIQKWYLMRFTGTDADIRLDDHEREFAQVQWVTHDVLLDRVVWFKRDSYAAILAEFATHLR